MVLKTAKQNSEVLAFYSIECQPESLPPQGITKWDNKHSFLKKQSGRVIENKGKAQKTNLKQTGNKATEVVENTGNA